MNPVVTTFFDEATFSATHVVEDTRTKQCAIVDPVLDYDPASGRTSTRSADRVAEHVRAKGLTVRYILETHVHADHLTAAPLLKELLGGKTVIGENVRIVQKTFAALFNAEPDFATDGRQFDKLVADGETFPLGDLEVRVVHTPGHTPACVTYVIGDTAFIGDTLFMPDFGTARCDFPGGDASQLYQSIGRILALPPQTRLYLCHDYRGPGRMDFRWETTVADERKNNLHVRDGVSEADFVAMRTNRDATLAMPALILPAVQVNMRAGHLPPAEPNGVRYLKIPVNAV